MPTFADDVQKGLSKKNKSISSKYFYDAEGSSIFQAIMKMPSYYLTDSEFEILETNKAEILKNFKANGDPFNLVEFGAGDGLKTKILIDYFLKQGVNFTYAPIDISSEALKNLSLELESKWPKLKINPLNTDYFKGLDVLQKESRRNVVMFLGSNLGNFNPKDADHFLSEIRAHLKPGDGLFIGLDLQKDPNVILRAYNDPEGITKSFNLNLLKRINRELGGHFDTMKFDFYCNYSPENGEVRSYIVSRVNQKVAIDHLKMEASFQQWETIHTEISRKFRLVDLPDLAADNGFEFVSNSLDCKHYFANTYWRAK